GRHAAHDGRREDRVRGAPHLWQHPEALAQRPDGRGALPDVERLAVAEAVGDRKSTRLNSSHDQISYAVFCLKKKKKKKKNNNKKNLKQIKTPHTICNNPSKFNTEVFLYM